MGTPGGTDSDPPHGVICGPCNRVAKCPAGDSALCMPLSCGFRAQGLCVCVCGGGGDSCHEPTIPGEETEDPAEQLHGLRLGPRA